jgi:hypothetical protein
MRIPAPVDGLAAFDRAGARALADSLEPGTALAFLPVEHHWAAPLFGSSRPRRQGGGQVNGGAAQEGRGVVVVLA